MIDSDEFIVPQKEDTIPDMIRNVKRWFKQPVDQMYFHNTVYFTDLIQNMVNESDLITNAALWHVNPEQFTHMKYLLDPQYCLLAFTHFCTEAVPNSTRGRKVMLPVTTAKSQHYKQCSTARKVSINSFSCSSINRKKTYYDPRILRFGPQLKRAMADVINDLYKI